MADILLINGEHADKLEAHRNGLQHFAFSVFLFKRNGELLIQKRAKEKYHSGGLWSNSCCSHFADLKEFSNKDETIKKRLKNELGVEFGGELKFLGIFPYRSSVGKDLIENEVDYIYIGVFDDEPVFKLNNEEVEAIRFVKIDELKKSIFSQKDDYTVWLRLILGSKLFDYV